MAFSLLRPGKSAALAVVQERTERQSLAVLSFDLTTAISYNRNGKLSKDVLNVIREVARRQSEINAVERQIQEIDRQTKEIHTEQNRIRSNMNSVRNSGDLYARYVQKLDGQETQLESLLEQRAGKQRELEQKRADLNDYIRGLNPSEVKIVEVGNDPDPATLPCPRCGEKKRSTCSRP